MTYTRSSARCPECGNDLWDIRGDKAKCGNCWYERPYHRRARGTGVTSSQWRTLNRIVSYYDGSRHSLDGKPTTELTELSATINEYGKLFVKVQTGKSVWTEEGVVCWIGRRGGISVCYALGLWGDNCQDRDRRTAERLGGRIYR